MSSLVLRKLLEKSPAAWALIRAAEVDILSGVSFEHPILDVGCGDGFFTKVLLAQKKEKYFEWGLDLSEEEIKEAEKSGVYENVVASSATDMPFHAKQFATVFSNGTLEHIKELDRTLKEISRVLKPGGRLIFTVPSSYLTSYLFFYKFFPPYGSLFNKIFKHYNLFSHSVWRKCLEKHGLEMVDYKYYNLKRQIQIHDLLTLLALPSFFNKAIFGRWILFPGLKSLTAPIEAFFLSKVYNNRTSQKEGGSLLVIARKE